MATVIVLVTSAITNPASNAHSSCAASNWADPMPFTPA